MAISPFTWATWDVRLSFGRKQWVQRGRFGKWQIETEDKDFSAKVVIRDLKSYFLTTQTVLLECRFLLGSVTQWTNTTEQEIKCQAMHETEIISLYTSHFWTIAEADYLRTWPRISCGWNGTSHTHNDDEFGSWNETRCFSDDDDSNSISPITIIVLIV